MKTLAVTPGDPAGIGPEIVWKSIRSGRLSPRGLICVGAEAPFRMLGAKIHPLNEDGSSNARAPRGPHVPLIPAPRGLPGFQSGWSVEKAVELVQAGRAHALVTGPISKERLRAGGYPYPGHTEMLAALCLGKSCSDDVTMMLANAKLRVALVTTHVPIHGVARVLTPKLILKTITQTHAALRQWWGIARPRIAVLGLNPHAGENGLIGHEEKRKIIPAIRRAQALGIRADGPHPADTFFALHYMGRKTAASGGLCFPSADAVVCMYHDQGLIPVKLIDFPRTINITLGLPILRTSVDHGVGFDIAGKGLADPSSFLAAASLARRLRRIA